MSWFCRLRRSPRYFAPIWCAFSADFFKTSRDASQTSRIDSKKPPRLAKTPPRYPTKTDQDTSKRPKSLCEMPQRPPNVSPKASKIANIAFNTTQNIPKTPPGKHVEIILVEFSFLDETRSSVNRFYNDSLLSLGEIKVRHVVGPSWTRSGALPQAN